MANQVPVKAIYSGSDITALGEFISTDKIASSYLNLSNSVGISELNVTDGSAGQVLSTDGAGTFSFVSTVDWTADQGATNIHAGNYTNTTYSAGTGVTLTGTSFSIGQAVATTSNVTFNDVTVTGTLTETSAAIYKENINPLSSQLENIMKLRPVEYDKKATGEHEIGLIADEVEKVLPDFVTQKDGIADSLNYSRMVSVLVKAVQELTEKVEKLSK